MPQILAHTISDSFNVYIKKFPDQCPHCHYHVVPRFLDAYRDDKDLYLSFFCVREKCGRYFVYQYTRDSVGAYYHVGPVYGTIKGIIHSDSIKSISPTFVELYSQAERAEGYNLLDICGVGYRKALEFLIKDYIIHTDPEIRLQVENKQLGLCIRDHITNPTIVDISKRAVWIGNDETHYVRKWEGMDITHLKQLIALTVHWIETEYLTQQMIASMPDPKKK